MTPRQRASAHADIASSMINDLLTKRSAPHPAPPAPSTLAFLDELTNDDHAHLMVAKGILERVSLRLDPTNG